MPEAGVGHRADRCPAAGGRVVRLGRSQGAVGVGRADGGAAGDQDPAVGQQGRRMREARLGQRPRGGPGAGGRVVHLARAEAGGRDGTRRLAETSGDQDPPVGQPGGAVQAAAGPQGPGGGPRSRCRIEQRGHIGRDPPPVLSARDEHPAVGQQNGRVRRLRPEAGERHLPGPGPAAGCRLPGRVRGPGGEAPRAPVRVRDHEVTAWPVAGPTAYCHTSSRSAKASGLSLPSRSSSGRAPRSRRRVR